MHGHQPPSGCPSGGHDVVGPDTGSRVAAFRELPPGTVPAAASGSIAVIFTAALFLTVTRAAAIIRPPGFPNEAMIADLLLAVMLLLAGSLLLSEHRRVPPGLVLPAGHRDGRWIRSGICGRPQRGRAGDAAWFEGVCRARAGEGDHTVAAAQARINTALATQALVTAFQPIYSLTTGTVIGAEALTRMVSSPVRSPETWFDEAESVGRGLDLEFLAMETALRAAGQLPENIYVAVNLSPQACMDPRLSKILLECGLPAGRIVVELTERAAVTEYGPLLRALTAWRQTGLRIAVDDAGAGYANMRHILHLKPDLIKLDRSIIASIDADRYKRALCAAMVSFAQETSAKIVAEGVETETELAAVKGLGLDSAQGYFLGKPSTSAAEWISWSSTSSPGADPGHQ